MNDGTQHTIKAGDSYTIRPGHDAWVEEGIRRCQSSSRQGNLSSIPGTP